MWSFFRCTVCLFGVVFGVRSAVFGLHFGARSVERGNRARDLSNMGPWSWRMMPFRVDFGARCAFSGWVLVCGAPFLRWILVISVHGASFLGSVLVRGAPFLVSILVRGVWCADFGADFGARCAFLESFLVCGGSILVHGVWCADFGADFVARCAFLGSILARCLFGIDFGIDFGAWCADVGVDHSQRARRSIKT